MDTSELTHTSPSSPPRNMLQAVGAANKASQDLVNSSIDEFHWCAEMDYQFGCDNLYRSSHSRKGIFDNSNSEISFTSNSDSSISGRYKSFDIHLAQIDIDTFKSEDIERISHNNYSRKLESSVDTLRTMGSLNCDNLADDTSKLLNLPNDDCEAISIDSLDLSIDNEISTKLIQKCSESDKTRYKIAMIETSAHSQMQTSSISTHSNIELNHTVNNNYINNMPASSNLPLNLRLMNDREKYDSQICNNPFMGPSLDGSSASARVLQSPGSLVQMFIQNRTCSNESSAFVDNGIACNGNYITQCDINNSCNEFNRLHSQVASIGETMIDNYSIEEVDDNSLNTVDSNELPLHVLDLSKKLRSMNLGKHTRYGSTSISPNTSYTSTTSSSTTTYDKLRPQLYKNTNPFIHMTESHKKSTRTTSTQFPEKFQDKEVQASFDEEQREPPVLVYYPNYSLPDLSFLQDIFKQEKPNPPVYLSPIKHEPPKFSTESSPRLSELNRRMPTASQRKCRPKSYTDYEISGQDFGHIKDWESLNLLLPDDFKEFVEKNNLLNFRVPKENANQYDGDQFATDRPYPIKATINPNNRATLQSVKLRSHRRHQPSNKRYSLQESGTTTQNCDVKNHYRNNHGAQMEYELINSCMTRSQTMPNCRPPFSCHPTMMHCAPANNFYHNYCHPCCHSPSIHSSSQSSPQKANASFDWDAVSSSSLKKLLSFLNKLDECSSDNGEEKANEETDKSDRPVNSVNVHKNNENSIYNVKVNNRNNRRPIERKAGNYPENPRDRHNSTRAAHLSKPEMKSSKAIMINANPVPGNSQLNKASSGCKTSSHSKATSPMATNRDNATANRRVSTAAGAAAEKTKIILKRPTTLKSGVSGIPVPKRTSSNSMIPVSKNFVPKEQRTKEYRLSGANNTRF